MLALLAAEVAALWWMAWGGHGTPFPALGLWVGAFAAYLLAARVVAASAGPPDSGAAAGDRGRPPERTARHAIDLRLIWLGGIVLRAGVLPAEPALSEDIYRYVWEGLVQLEGASPYAFEPGSAALEALRTEWWPRINHPHVSAIYPPGAQLIFAFLAWIAPAWWIFKLAWLVPDLAVAWLVGRLSPRMNRLPLLLYLWSPLVIVEVAWNGHLDPLGVAPMLAAVALAHGAVLSRRRPPPPASLHKEPQPMCLHETLAPEPQPEPSARWRTDTLNRVESGSKDLKALAWRTGALLGIGASVKFAPLGALPALWRRHGPIAVLAALAALLVLYIPYVEAGSALFEGLRIFADSWEFNPGAYHLLKLAPGHPDAGKWVGAAIVAGIAIHAALRGWTLGRTLFWVCGSALLVSPTIHPWYLLWALPFACLSANRGWLLFTGTVFLAYAGRDAYLATGVWAEPAWLRWAIHLPPAALLAWDGWRGGRTRSGVERIVEAQSDR